MSPSSAYLLDEKGQSSHFLPPPPQPTLAAAPLKLHQGQTCGSGCVPAIGGLPLHAWRPSLYCLPFPPQVQLSASSAFYWRGCRALNRKGKRCLKIKFNYRGRGWQGFKVLRGAGGKGHRILFPSCRSNGLNGFRLHIITSSLSGPAVLILLHSCGRSILL